MGATLIKILNALQELSFDLFIMQNVSTLTVFCCLGIDYSCIKIIMDDCRMIL